MTFKICIFNYQYHSMRHILETARLYLREFIPEDAIHFFEMNNDPEVIRYTGDLPFLSIQAASQFIINYNAYAETGMGRYAVLRKNDHAFLGWCGLKYHPKSHWADIGFRFYKKYWKQGYAIESAKVVIHYAFTTLKLPSLIAHAHIDNKASHRVIKKCGMQFVKQLIYDEQPAILYRLDNTITRIT